MKWEKRSIHNFRRYRYKMCTFRLSVIYKNPFFLHECVCIIYTLYWHSLKAFFTTFSFSSWCNWKTVVNICLRQNQSFLKAVGSFRMEFCRMNGIYFLLLFIESMVRPVLKYRTCIQRHDKLNTLFTKFINKCYCIWFI